MCSETRCPTPDQIPENVEYAAQELLEAPTDQRPAMLEGIRVEWAERFAAMSIEKPVFEGLRRVNRAQWLKPEIRVRAQHLQKRERSDMQQ